MSTVETTNLKNPSSATNNIVLNSDGSVGGDLATTLASKGDISTNGSWTSYTPAWTNLTVGDGTVTAAYLEVGKLVYVRVRLVFGSTTSLPGGDVTVSLPINRAALNTPYLDSVLYRDSGTALIVGITNVVTSAGVDQVNLRVGEVTGVTLKANQLGPTTPFTWTTSDEILLALAYEGA